MGKKLPDLEERIETKEKQRKPSKIFELLPELFERAKSQFRLKDYKKSRPLRTANGVIQPMEVYTLKEAATLTGRSQTSIYFLVGKKSIASIDYIDIEEDQRVPIPGHELLRMYDRPRLWVSYDFAWLKEKYNLNKALIKDLVRKGVLKEDKHGKIKSVQLISMYDKLVASKYPELGTKIQRDEWTTYTRKGKPLKIDVAQAVKPSTAVKEEQVIALKNYFGQLESKKYFCILYKDTEKAVLIYAVPFNINDEDDKTGREIHSMFAKAFRVFCQTRDENVKGAHYHEKIYSQNKFIGAIYTTKPSALEAFLERFGIWAHLNNQYEGRRLLPAGIELVKGVANELKSGSGLSDRAKSISSTSTFHPLKVILREIMAIYSETPT